MIWVCIASGQSLKAEDIQYCRMQGWGLATCNDSYRMVPDADVFYAMDREWWVDNVDDVLSTLKDGCQVWTGCPEIAEQYGLKLAHRDGVPRGTYSKREGLVHTGLRSGHNLINIVGWSNPSLVVLLGYDEHGAHWHDHNKPISQNYQVIDEYDNLCVTVPFPVVNCSPGSAIRSFPQIDLGSVNGWHASNQAPA